MKNYVSFGIITKITISKIIQKENNANLKKDINLIINEINKKIPLEHYTVREDKNTYTLKINTLIILLDLYEMLQDLYYFENNSNYNNFKILSKAPDTLLGNVNKDYPVITIVDENDTPMHLDLEKANTKLFEETSDEDYSGYFLQYGYNKWDKIEIKIKYIKLWKEERKTEYLDLINEMINIKHANFTTELSNCLLAFKETTN